MAVKKAGVTPIIPEEVEVTFENKKENPYLITLSIVGAGLLIAIAILFKDQLPQSGNQNNPQKGPVDVIAAIGLKSAAFDACLVKKNFAPKIQADATDAQNAGGQGTPYTIVIAPNGKRFLIAGAYPYEEVKKTIDEALANTDGGPTADEKKDPIYNMAEPSTADHLRGNPNAPIKIVEFSDLQCPFCKAFQTTMQQVMAEYGQRGQVAWVYRHLPLTSIHRYALPWAEESECAAQLGGSDKFWEYIDTRFENQT